MAHSNAVARQDRTPAGRCPPAMPLDLERSEGGHRRWIILAALIALVFVLAACGDDDATASPKRFCDLNTELDQVPDSWLLAPTEARDSLQEQGQLLDEAAKAAPDEIRSAAQGLADNHDLIRDIWESADFDVAQLDDSQLQYESELQSTFEAQFADFAAVERWLTKNCS